MSDTSLWSRQTPTRPSRSTLGHGEVLHRALEEVFAITSLSIGTDTDNGLQPGEHPIVRKPLQAVPVAMCSHHEAPKLTYGKQASANTLSYGGASKSRKTSFSRQWADNWSLLQQLPGRPVAFHLRLTPPLRFFAPVLVPVLLFRVDAMIRTTYLSDFKQKERKTISPRPRFPRDTPCTSRAELATYSRRLAWRLEPKCSPSPV